MPTTIDGDAVFVPVLTQVDNEERRLAPPISLEQEVWTYQDAVEHILDVFDVPRDARSHRLARQAVLESYHDLPNLHEWPCYRRPHMIQLVAPYNTGTVTYDATGGAYERLLTLSGGTWPEWARFGVIRINTVDYPIQERIDNTRLTLDLRRSPKTDLSTVAFTLYRTKYPLPLDFRRRGRVIDPVSRREMTARDPDTVMVASVVFRGYGTPFETTVVEDEHYLGGLALQFNPPTTAARTHVFLYDRMPKPLRTEAYSTGSIEIASGSASVIGTGTGFTSKMIGAVLRISNDSQTPTSIVGDISSTDIRDPAWTRIVTSVPSATELTVDSALDQNASSLGFTLSDPLDFHIESMLTAFWRLCELRYARLVGRDDVLQRQLAFNQQLDVARDAVRHSFGVETANPMFDDGYSLIGSVNVRPTL
jgi:hypothetical protein